MYKYFIMATLALTTTLSYAGTSGVTSTPLVKLPADTKKPIYINTGDEAGGFGCPDGFDLFVRALAPPAPKDKKDATPIQGDYDSFYYAKSANPAQPAIIVSRPGIQEYVPACLKVTK